jgi:hypothetical protein
VTGPAWTGSRGSASLWSPGAYILVRLRPQMRTMGYGCGPNACGPGWSGRRYLTKDERLEMLREYEKDLANELKAVKERLEAVAAE